MKNSAYDKLNDRNWLEREYITNCRTASDIAQELDAHYTTVRRAIKRLDLKDRGKRQFPMLYDKAWLETQLQTKTIQRIAKEIDSSVGNVAYRIKRLGIVLGNRSESIKAGQKKRYPDGRSGKNASNWKGGRRAMNGYVVIYAPDHPRANNGSVFEHIVVAEKTLGRSIETDEVVHHLNGDKQDNRPENLEVVSRAGHVHKHYTDGENIQAFVERIAELESEVARLKSTPDSS